MRNSFILSTLAIIILSSFNKKQATMRNYQNRLNQETTLEIPKWRLTKIYNKDSFVQVSNQAFIHFNTSDGGINGNGSCNSFGGKLTADGNSLRFYNIFSTKMYCSDVRNIEDQFFRKLQLVNRYEIKGNRLLLCAGDVPVLEFDAG